MKNYCQASGSGSHRAVAPERRESRRMRSTFMLTFHLRHSSNCREVEPNLTGQSRERQSDWVEEMKIEGQGGQLWVPETAEEK